MKLVDIYRLAIAKGRDADPRSKERLDQILKQEKEKYDKLDQDEKEEFDRERLTNPYADTRILNDSDQEIGKVLVGVDIGPIELLLAKKVKADAIIAHHPQGKALSRLNQVMDLQADLLHQFGIPINVAESLLEERIEEVSRKVSPLNHYQMIDAAKILEIPMICIHTPADNLVYQYVTEQIKSDKPETVEELLKTLKKIPEYKKATRRQIGPQIFAGKPERRCGKIALTEVTGGTSGSKNLYEKISQAGIGTIVGMHMEEEYKEEAEKHHLNVVIAGHMASDSVGINLFLKELEDRGIRIVRCSGLIDNKD